MDRRTLITAAATALVATRFAQAARPRPRLGIETSAFAGVPLSNVLVQLRKSGYRRLELGGAHLELGVTPPTEAAARIRQVRDEGFELVAVTNVPRLATPDETARAAAVARWRRAIDEAAALGVPLLGTELTGDSKKPEEGEAAWRRAMDELLPHLAAAKVRLAVEPHPGDFFEDASRALALFRGYGSPWLGYMHCVPHGDFLGPSAANVIRAAGPLLFHVHVADSLRRTRIMAKGGAGLHLHMALGDGEMDLRGTFEALDEIGFGGVLSVQLLSYRDRPGEEAVRARKWLQRTLGARLTTA